MKKTILLIAAMVAMVAAQAQEHVEFKWHRFYGVAGYDYSFNLNKTDFNDTVSFHGFYGVAGWQIRKESGIGLGVEYLLDPKGAFSQLPVFIELRSHYLRNRVTPFSVLQVGYSIPLGASSSGKNAIHISTGGPTWCVQVGARCAINRIFAVSAFVGYQGICMNRVERKQDDMMAKTRPLLLHNLKVGFGVNF